MAKVKKALIGNWELTEGGIFHKSWAGTTYRARGSATAYTTGCQFHKKPPPPPQLPVTWVLRIYVDGGAIGSQDIVFVNGIRATEITYEEHYEIRSISLPLGYLVAVTPIGYAVTRDQATKTWRISYYDLDFGDYHEEDITLLLPPFNGQTAPQLPWVDSETFTLP